MGAVNSKGFRLYSYIYPKITVYELIKRCQVEDLQREIPIANESISPVNNHCNL